MRGTGRRRIGVVRPSARRVVLLAFLLAAPGGLAGCAGSNPFERDDLPANRYEVPEEAPNTNVIPDYGGKLKSEEERERAMRELEAAGKQHSERTQEAIGSRRY